MDNHRMGVDMEAKEAEEGRADPVGSVILTTIATRTEDTEVINSQGTPEGIPPRPRLVKNQTAVRPPANRKEQKPKL